MTCRRTHFAPLLALALFFALVETTRAASITYVATDLLDAVPGEDVWRYDYLVGDHTFGPDQGFAVYFDFSLYADLEDPPPSVNADWDVLVLQPATSLSSDGIYDALALTASASLADLFSVTFRWLGGPGTMPGSQPFELYALDGSGAPIAFLSDRTLADAAPVPEPATLLLVGGGLLAAAARRGRARRGGHVGAGQSEVRQ